MGISQSDASLELLGTFHVDIRIYRGEALPDNHVSAKLPWKQEAEAGHCAHLGP